MYQASQEGRIQDTMKAQINANRVISVLISVGVLAGIKAMLRWRGLPVGPPRPPNNRLTEEDESRLRRAIKALDFEAV